MSSVKNKYSAYHYSVTKIESICSSNIAPKNTTLQIATGFFYAEKGHVYLITNRHVVIREDRAWYPDSLRFYYHIDRKDPKKIKYHKINLYDENKSKKWLEHPDNDVTVKNGIIDVIAVDISEIKEKLDTNYLWQRSHFISYAEPGLDTAINLLGFPLGFYDKKNHLPISKSGHMASVYNIDFNNRPRFLVDIYTNPGCSGGPVIYQLGSSNILSGSFIGRFFRCNK
jgi:V8-like Glu-specific endopeptidase